MELPSDLNMWCREGYPYRLKLRITKLQSLANN